MYNSDKLIKFFMGENLNEGCFDPELFKDYFKLRVQEYAEINLPIYGENYNYNFQKNELRLKKIKVLYEKILGECVEALLFAENINEIWGIIKENLVGYCYENKVPLFPQQMQVQFYHDLAFRLAEKNKGEEV